MFNNSNKQRLDGSNQNGDNQTISSLDETQESNNGASINSTTTVKQQKNSEHKLERQSNLSDSLTSQSLQIDEQQEDAITLCDISENKSDESVEPFGVIRGIAIGPDDELIVAGESRVRVLQPGSQYLFKRELFIQSRLGGHHGTNATTNNGRLCSMTYDPQSKQLLALYTSCNSGGTPFIQIADYQSGKAKFIIDSFDSKLIRPSCLATYGQHVIVADLGDDCIKKYRFY